jgi:chemotaxis protein CheD
MITNDIYVSTGEVAFGKAGQELVSHAIGSCIVVTLYNPATESGAMAHIMLPGAAPTREHEHTNRYAQNAITSILNMMGWPRTTGHDLQVCLIGGGNVLKRSDDIICSKNIASVKEIIEDYNLNVCAESLGGEIRRSARLDVRSGAVYIREDGAAERLLWSSRRRPL